MNKTKDQIQVECLEAVLPYDRAGGALCPGTGKTLLGLKHMLKHMNDCPRFLVVAPTLAILQSWIDEAIKFQVEDLIPHITLSTYLSLYKQDYDYDVIYLDEAHALLKSHVDWLKGYRGKILGLTGTPPSERNREKTQFMNEFYPIKYSYLTDTAVEDDVLNDYKIILHPLQLEQKKTMKVTTKAGASWYTSEQVTYDYWSNKVANANPGKDKQLASIMRMKEMMKFPSKDILARRLLYDTNNKIILFANTQEQADSFGIKSYHSNNSDSEENLSLFRSGIITKLACVNQLSEGVNILGLKECLILHSFGNERKSAQRLSRCMRLNPDDLAIINILMYKDTIDETWVERALEGYNKDKIFING